MSLDAAQILAPLAPGLTPAAPPSAGGDASGGGDFAALLESLAGLLKSARTPAELVPGGIAPPSPELPAVEASVALAVDLPPLPGVTREGLGLAFAASLRIEPAPDAEVEAGPARDVAPEPGTPQANTLIPGAFPSPPVPLQQDPQPRTEARAGALAPETPRPAISPAGTATAVAPQPLAPQAASTQAPLAAANPAQSIPAAVVDGGSAEGLEGVSEGVADTRRPPRAESERRAVPATPGQGAAPAAAAAFALAPGVLAVTGRRLEGQADPGRLVPGEAESDPAIPEASAPQAPVEAARQAALLPAGGQGPEVRLAEARPAANRRREGAVPADAAAPRPEGAGTPLQAQGPVPLPGAARLDGRVEAVQARAAGETPGPLSEDRDEPALRAEAADPSPTLSGAAPAVETRSSALAGGEAAPLAPRAGAETIAALAAQMARRLDDGVTRFDLELNPGDLGRVDVRLEIDASGGIRAAFTFEDAHAAGELGRRADELQKSLESAGFNLSGGLTFDVSGDRSQGRSPAWADARDGRSPAPSTPERETGREGPSDITEALSGRRIAARAGVDIRI